jgi:hypothetical protein
LALQIEYTIQIFWKKVYKLNWRYESLIQPGFVRIWGSRILIFEDSFCAIVLRILQDLWKQVEFFENQSKNRIHKPNLLKTLRIPDPWYETNPDSYCKAQIKPFFESGFVTTKWYESMDLQNESMFLRISYTIPASRISHLLEIHLLQKLVFQAYFQISMVVFENMYGI